MEKEGKAAEPQDITSTVASIVSDCFSIIEELKEELQNWLDGMSEDLRGGSKAEQLEEAINQLEASSAPTISDELGEVVVIYRPPAPRRKNSRSTRRDDAVEMLSYVIDKLDGLDVEGAEELKTDLENARDEWETCEFPGMFG